MQKPLRSGLTQTSVHSSLFFPACLKLTPDHFQLWAEVVNLKKKKKTKVTRTMPVTYQAEILVCFFFFFHFRYVSTMMAFLWKFFGLGGKYSQMRVILDRCFLLFSQM